jgi:integrase
MTSRLKLTKRVVESFQPQTKEYIVWCESLTGFGVRIQPTGRKTFIAMFRAKGRQTAPKKFTIGAYSDSLTVDEARKKATEVLSQAKLGVDEAEKRAIEKQQLTVRELCDEYLLHGVDGKKASTIATDRARMAIHILPKLGTKLINKITDRDVRTFLKDIATVRTIISKKTGHAVKRGGKGTATRTVRLLGGIFTYAKKEGYISVNPVHGVKLFADGKNQRYLNNEEFKRLGDALREAESKGLPWVFDDTKKAKHRPKQLENTREIFSPHVVGAIRLLMLTGCRLREILHLKYTDIDFQRGILNFRDSKTGAKQLLVAMQVMNVIEKLPRISEFVVAGENPLKPRSDLNRPWRRLVKHAGLDGLRIHDLRHSYASAGVEQGLGLYQVGKLLGHKDTSTTQRYAHLGDDPMRRAANLIAGSIVAATGDKIELEDSTLDEASAKKPSSPASGK